MPHAATIDEHLLDCTKGDITEGKREHNRNAKHLACVIEHIENACCCASRMRFYGTHDSIGVGRNEEARTASHECHIERQLPVWCGLGDGCERKQPERGDR